MVGVGSRSWPFLLRSRMLLSRLKGHAQMPLTERQHPIFGRSNARSSVLGSGGKLCPAFLARLVSLRPYFFLAPPHETRCRSKPHEAAIRY